MHKSLLSPAGLEKVSFGVLVTLLLALAPLGPILQPQAYHHFADTRMLGGIPNVIDVLTNLAFLLVGMAGLRFANRAPYPQRASLHLFALGMVLTALGSAFYHWAPTDQSLAWDRLPMTLAFAGALGAMAAQYLGAGAAMRWQNAWLYLGLTGVVIWVISGDLRLYVVAQIGGFLIGLAWLTIGYRAPNTVALPWGWVWLAYGLAKLAESGDAWLWTATSELVAGHGFKHLLAAAGTVPLLLVLSKLPACREPLDGRA